MNFRECEKEEMKIIGMETRTTNGNGQCMSDIGTLWQKFLSGNQGDLIQDKVNPYVMYGIYMDYETDETGTYSFVIGYEVDSFQKVPEGMVQKTLPASKYQIYTAKGQMPEAIGAVWQHVWSNKPPRTYTGDFEVYDERYDGSPNSEVDVYIAVK